MLFHTQTFCTAHFLREVVALFEQQVALVGSHISGTAIAPFSLSLGARLRVPSATDHARLESSEVRFPEVDLSQWARHSYLASTNQSLPPTWLCPAWFFQSHFLAFVCASRLIITTLRHCHWTHRVFLSFLPRAPLGYPLFPFANPPYLFPNALFVWLCQAHPLI